MLFKLSTMLYKFSLICPNNALLYPIIYAFFYGPEITLPLPYKYVWLQYIIEGVSIHIVIEIQISFLCKFVLIT